MKLGNLHKQPERWADTAFIYVESAKPTGELNLSTGERFVHSGHDEGPHRGGVGILMSKQAVTYCFVQIPRKEIP